MESGQETTVTSEAPFSQFIDEILAGSTDSNLLLGKAVVIGERRIAAMTPQDREWLKNNRAKFSTAGEFALICSQVPRLRRLVNKGLLYPEEAADALVGFENALFRQSPDDSLYPPRPTIRILAALERQLNRSGHQTWDREVRGLIDLLRDNPEGLFGPAYSPESNAIYNLPTQRAPRQ